MSSQTPFVRWYGERGIVNAVITCLAAEPEQRVQRLLNAIRWAGQDAPEWLNNVQTSTCFIEWGLADFGNPDIVIVCETTDGL